MLMESLKDQPILSTTRLVLRPFTLDDSERVQELAADRRIANTTASIPHPYPDGVARDWISSHAEKWLKQESVSYAITLKDTGDIIGCVSIANMRDGIGELGYWVGVDYWNKGYCTEACKALIDFVFNKMSISRIFAKHFARNPASGRVMLKSGMSLAGTGSETVREVAEEIKIYEIRISDKN